jgi:hypothetical protein
MSRLPDNYPANGMYNRLSAVKNPVNIINFVHRIIPEEIQPETIAV